MCMHAIGEAAFPASRVIRPEWVVGEGSEGREAWLVGRDWSGICWGWERKSPGFGIKGVL